MCSGGNYSIKLKYVIIICTWKRLRVKKKKQTNNDLQSWMLPGQETSRSMKIMASPLPFTLDKITFSFVIYVCQLQNCV